MHRIPSDFQHMTIQPFVECVKLAGGAKRKYAADAILRQIINELAISRFAETSLSLRE
jgi:hypothetical protein